MLRYPQSSGFLLDGFPRELGQAKTFENEVLTHCQLYEMRRKKILKYAINVLYFIFSELYFNPTTSWSVDDYDD